MDVYAAHLLEISKLCDFHAVEPDFPAETPGTQCRRFPVVFDKADIVFSRVEAQYFQTLQIQFLDIVRARFADDLELMMLIQPVRIIAITAIGRTAGRFDVCDVPWFRSQRTQERRRIHCTCPFFYIIRFLDDAALGGPKFLQSEAHFLKVHVAFPSCTKKVPVTSLDVTGTS